MPVGKILFVGKEPPPHLVEAADRGEIELAHGRDNREAAKALLRWGVSIVTEAGVNADRPT